MNNQNEMSANLNIDELCECAGIAPYVLSVAIVNLKNIALNYAKIKKELSKDAIIGAVVKSNAYGFGAIPVSKKLYDVGCRHFFVATFDEGIEIRRVLEKDARIYILSGFLSGCESCIEKYDLTVILNDEYQINLFIEYSKRMGKKINAVIQVDTGLNRNGLSKKDIEKNIKKIKENICLEFVMSHLACADVVDHEMNKLQLKKYKEILDFFDDDVKSSFSATNGFFLGEEYQFDILRLGKALYGFSIREDKIDYMLPVMDVFAKIIQISEISIGDKIGYGATFIAERNMKIITVGIGYADGFMRKFSGFGYAFLGGKKIPVVGRVSMNCIVLDVTDVDESYVKVGEWVALIKHPHITLEKWALEMDTLPHEVTCRLGKGVKRIYVE